MPPTTYISSHEPVCLFRTAGCFLMFERFMPAYNADDLSLVDDGKAFDPVLIGPPNSLSDASRVTVIAGLVMTSAFNSMGH